MDHQVQKSNLIASWIWRGVTNVVVPDAGDAKLRGVPKAVVGEGAERVPAGPPE